MSRIRISGLAVRTAAVFAVAPLLVGLTAAESFASAPGIERVLSSLRPAAPPHPGARGAFLRRSRPSC